MPLLRSLDLFSGIGGLTLALEGVAKPVLYVDIDPTSQAVLARQVGKGLPSARVHDDILTLKTVPKADIIIAGVPCIGWSTRGNMKALKQPQSALFYEMLRVLDASHATSVFLENVPGIISKSYKQIVKELALLRGFELRWTFVTASQLGAPHERNRWFCLGIKPRSPLKSVVLRPGKYVPFNWSGTQPPRMLTTDSTAKFDARWGLLGNSVVPDAARFAFMVLFSGGAIGELRAHKQPLHFTQKMQLTNERKGCSGIKGCITLVAPTTGKISYFEPKVPAQDIGKKDWGLVFDPAVIPLPLKKSPNMTRKRLSAPVHARLFSTPRHATLRSCRVLTERSVQDLPTQIRFEKKTVRRSASINPQFGEFMMGYSKDFTLV
jgi:hypothetical protein